MQDDKISLSAVITWLSNGCNTADAIKELQAYERILARTYAELAELRSKYQSACETVKKANENAADFERQWYLAKDDAEELREYKQRVNTAAEAIINRWYSPNWAWDQHTGTLINDLRVAIGGNGTVVK